MKDKDFLDPAEVEKQEEAAALYKREQRLRIGDLRKVLSIPEGRRLIWSELSRAKIFADFFSLNSLEMAKFCGERSVGLKLLADVMEAKPEAFYQMYTEASSKEKAAKKEEES
jgi:hypothetical protein